MSMIIYKSYPYHIETQERTGIFMIFTSRGTVDTNFLRYAFGSFYYSTGYCISFFSPDNLHVPFLPSEEMVEPYLGYYERALVDCDKKYPMNQASIHYISPEELMILFPISHRNQYWGTVVIGPMILKGMYHKISTEKPFPIVQQFQIQYLTNLVNLIFTSTYYDPTVIASLSIKEEAEVIKPSAEKITNRLLHHNMEQEEKILLQILTSSDSFIKLAEKHLPKFSSLVSPPLAEEPVRSEKNRFIVSATIVSRAAIKLGLPSEQAFSYSDYFINLIEQCKTLDEIWNLQLSLFSFFREELKKSKTSSSFHAITNQLLHYIEQNIDTNLPLQDICDELKLDYKYASNCFKKDTGLGFNKYLTNEKIKLAKRELATTELPIQEIAEMVGYNSAYYFTRAFRSNTGLSPTEYRKRSLLPQ
jgi:AraC-like DNA-binding protein